MKQHQICAEYRRPCWQEINLFLPAGLFLCTLILLPFMSCGIFETPRGTKDYTQVAEFRYDPDSFWYTPLTGNEAVDPQSQVFIEAMVNAHRRDESADTLYEMVLIMEGGSVPVFYADEDDPRVTVPITTMGYGAEGLTQVPLPEGVIGDSATDGHLVVVDSQLGVAFDFWQFRVSQGRWMASAAAVSSLNSDGVHRDRFSVAASGFALGSGLIWPQELLEGPIDHALVFGYPLTRQKAFTPPATRSDGRSSDPAALPMGALLTFPADYDLETRPDPGLNLYELRIARAIQEYGMYLYDTGTPGSIVEINGVNPRSFSSDPYAGIPRYDPRGGYADMGNIPLHELVVLEIGEVRSWGEEYPPEIAFKELYYGTE